MRHSAKNFLQFLNEALNESHHDIDAIWQMKSDVSYFLTEVVKMLGGNFVREFNNLQSELSISTQATMKVYEINGVRFGLLRAPELHRTQFYYIADPAQIDKLFTEIWEPDVELEDHKRVFTLKRRAVNGDMFSDIFHDSDFSHSRIKASLAHHIGLPDIVARKVQFGWRADQKTKKVAVSRPVLTDQPEWKELEGFGVEFASTLENLKHGTLIFKIPIWAVEKRYQNSAEPRKTYGDKNLDYVGQMIVGRKDSVIRWWDFMPKPGIKGTASKRIFWSPGDNLTSLEHYRGSLRRLMEIMREEYRPYSRNGINYNEIFKHFRFKEGWNENTLDVSRIDQGLLNAMDDLWG